MISWSDIPAEIAALDKCLMLYEGQGGKRFSEVELSSAKNIGLIVGSEGGFDESEVNDAVSAGSERIWLGNRILRCETAPISALSILMFLTNNV